MDCGDLDKYKGLTPDNRLDVLRDFVDDWAEANDFDPPDVVSGAQPDDPATSDFDESEARAWYDPNTNTLGFHPEFLKEGDPEAALSSAGHELAHAQVKDWFGDDPDWGSDEWSDASEWYGDLFGDSYADDLKDACDDDPPPESPAEPDTGDDEDDGEGAGEVEEEGDEGGGDQRPKEWRMPPEDEAGDSLGDSED